MFFSETIMNRIDHLHANFQMTMNSSSYALAVETASKDSSPPKLSRKTIFFVCIYVIISLEKLFSVSTKFSKASF